MANDINLRQEVKKHVATIHTSGELSFIERKLVNVFLLNSFDRLLEDRKHSIPVNLLLPMIGWSASTNITDLKKALVKIASTPVEFDLLGDAKDQWGVSSLISSASIKNGICSYEYSTYLAEKMAKPEIYATINIAIQNQFTGVYALNLYENCKRFRRVGSTGFIDVDIWRKLLGATSKMYDAFRHFSNHVIKKAVIEINSVSDIDLTVEYKRENRKVTQIKFIIKDNPQKSIYESGELDQYDEIRKTPAYTRLISHGIGDKLAVSYVAQESETKINEIIDYVEQRDNKKKISSTAGYIRTLVESKANTTESTYETKRKTEKSTVTTFDSAQDKQLSDKEQTFKQTWKSTPPDVKKVWISKYLESDGAGRAQFYNEEKIEFKKGEPNMHFLGWLRGKL